MDIKRRPSSSRRTAANTRPVSRASSPRKPSRAYDDLRDEFSKNRTIDGFIQLVMGLFRNPMAIWHWVGDFIFKPVADINNEIKAERLKRTKIEGFKDVRRHHPDYIMLIFIVAILLVGLVMMYSLSPLWANFRGRSDDDSSLSAYSYFWKHLTFVGLGLAAFFTVKSIPLDFIYKKANLVIGVGFILCAGLAAISFVTQGKYSGCRLGGCRWIEVGGFSIQPAEVLKIGMLLYFAVVLGMRTVQGEVNKWRKTLLPASILVGFMLFLVAIMQKDLGTAISGLVVVAFQFFAAGISWRKIGLFSGVMVALGVLLIAIAPHRIDRISTFSNRDCSNLSSDEAKKDYHVCRAQIAIGSGGLFGVGIGNSVQASGYLPEIINDSIFAAIAEVFGFVGSVAILGLFLALIYRILRIAAHLKDPVSRFVAIGVCGWFATHTLINALAMTGAIPLTGITMPLVSYGGTSMLLIMAALGLVFNISSYTSPMIINEKEVSNANISSRRRVGRTRRASRGSF